MIENDVDILSSARKKNNSVMEDSEVVEIMEKFINSALNFANSELSTERSAAIRAYYGKPYGDEEPNHSAVVDRSLYDTIEWMLPTIMEIFFGSGQVMQFDPTGPDDVDEAILQTKIVNGIISHHNKGFTSILTWIKDALIQKNGYVKFIPIEKEKIETETYENLTSEQYSILMQETSADRDNCTIEVIEHIEHVDEIDFNGSLSNVLLHDIKIKTVRNQTEISFFPVPPEEILIAPSHAELSLRDCQMVIHQRDMTVSDLIKMGFDPDVLKDLPTAQLPTTPSFQQEYIQRQYLNDVYINRLIYTDESMRPIRIAEGYGYIDYDGDGISELNQIFYSSGKVLKVSPFEYMPFAGITPTILSHQHFGLSIADVMLDLQRIKTQLWRQCLDNIYTTNNNRHVINDSVVNADDLYQPQPGQIIRCSGNPYEAIMPLQVSDVSSSVMGMMNYVDDLSESRSGVSKNMTGLNPDILSNNKGDASVWRLMTAAQQRIGFIARCFAETGFRDLFLGLHQLIRKYQNVQQTFLVDKQWININPREWKERENVSVRVGLGNGNKDIMRNAYTLFGQIQNVLLSGGKNNLVSDSNIFNLISSLADTFNIKNIDEYFTDPNSQQAIIAAQQRAQVMQKNQSISPEALQIQLKQMELAQRDREAKIDAQVSIQKEQIWKEIEAMKLSQRQFGDMLNASVKDNALVIENSKLALEESKHIHEFSQKTQKDTHDMMVDLINSVKGKRK